MTRPLAPSAAALAASLAVLAPASAQTTASGSASILFQTPTSGDFDGVGTGTLAFGTAASDGDRNRLEVAGIDFLTQADAPFAVASLSYFNGITQNGSNPSTIPVGIELELATPVPATLPLSFGFDFESTPNNFDDPVLDADFLRFEADAASSFTFEVTDQELTFELLGFSDDGGATIVDEFVLAENATVESVLFASFSGSLIEDPLDPVDPLVPVDPSDPVDPVVPVDPTPTPTPNPVPTPSALLAGLTGFAALAARRRRG